MSATEETQRKALNAFGELDGVGPNLAMHLWKLGLRSKDDIATSDPDDLYEKDCKRSGGSLDRCVLYVYRCVVAVCKDAAENPNNSTLDPSLHKWWNWSDKNIRKREHKPAQSKQQGYH